MIEIIKQSIADYDRGVRIVGLSIVKELNTSYIICHRQTDDFDGSWSIILGKDRPTRFGIKGFRASREEFIDAVTSRTPEYIDWLLFNIADIDSGEICNVE